MTKKEFMVALRAMYRVANYSDSEFKAEWTKPEMAGEACCQHLDRMIHDLVACGAFTQEDVDWLHDTL